MPRYVIAFCCKTCSQGVFIYNRITCRNIYEANRKLFAYALPKNTLSDYTVNENNQLHCKHCDIIIGVNLRDEQLIYTNLIEKIVLRNPRYSDEVNDDEL